MGALPGLEGPPSPMSDARLFADAVQRNREAILATLRTILPAHGLVLEVASGSGEHVVHLAAALPGVVFQPSDRDPAALASVDAWVAHCAVANVRPAVLLDAASQRWPVGRADAVLCINTVHIAPWAATVGLIRNAARVLSPGGLLVLYGPFGRGDVPMVASNAAFDTDLRARNPEWGVRHLDAVAALATAFEAPAVVEMPANNLIVVFRWGSTDADQASR